MQDEALSAGSEEPASCGRTIHYSRQNETNYVTMCVTMARIIGGLA